MHILIADTHKSISGIHEPIFLKSITGVYEFNNRYPKLIMEWADWFSYRLTFRSGQERHFFKEFGKIEDEIEDTKNMGGLINMLR